MKDCQNYLIKLKPGGLFCGHDYDTIPEVKKAVDDFAKSINVNIKQEKKDIWYFIKKESE